MHESFKFRADKDKQKGSTRAPTGDKFSYSEPFKGSSVGSSLFSAILWQDGIMGNRAGLSAVQSSVLHHPVWLLQ